jgi:hypothetical protein
VTYTIPDSGRDPGVVIAGLGVSQAISTCELVTEVSYFNPQTQEATEVRPEADLAEVFMAGNERYMRYKPDQSIFLNDLEPTFGRLINGVNADNYVNITVFFYTYDKANPDAFVVDPVTLQIFGNGQKKSDLCDFNDLQIVANTAMSGTREYKVGEDMDDGWTFSFPVSTQIYG